MSILGTAADFGDSKIEDFPTIHETSGYSGTLDNLKGPETEDLANLFIPETAPTQREP